ncbi:MAG: TrmH family RNA methyltransferase [Candidatus Delongbacteria bacterium]
MLSRSKFNKLKDVTRYFKIADELSRIRQELIRGITPDMENIRNYLKFLKESDGKYKEEIEHIVLETDHRIKLELTHFLYHTIKEDMGYPEPESRFIKMSADVDNVQKNTCELVIILENLRSAHNVGSVIRSCECFGIKQLILCGITPGTDNPKISKTAKGAEKYVDIISHKNVRSVFDSSVLEGYSLIGAETGPGSDDLSCFSFDTKTAIVLGNEEIGLTKETLGLCQNIVSVKMRGTKNSLNIANCASVLMYDYRVKTDT